MTQRVETWRFMLWLDNDELLNSHFWSFVKAEHEAFVRDTPEVFTGSREEFVDALADSLRDLAFEEFTDNLKPSGFTGYQRDVIVAELKSIDFRQVADIFAEQFKF